MFDLYTFINSNISSAIDLELLGLEGSVGRLLAIYAFQMSQNADAMRNIYYSTIVSNKDKEDLERYLIQKGITYPKNLPLSEIKKLALIITKMEFPRKGPLISLLSELFSLDEKYISVNEGINDGSIEIPVLLHSESIYRWNEVDHLKSIINNFRAAGINYTYKNVLFVKSTPPTATTTINFP
jgi:hypothetical protein